MVHADPHSVGEHHGVCANILPSRSKISNVSFVTIRERKLLGRSMGSCGMAVTVAVAVSLEPRKKLRNK